MSTIQWIAMLMFWGCVGLVVYTYIGYPLVLWGISRLFGRNDEPRLLADSQLPTMSLLIAAHDEEACIEERLHNALAMDYPREKLQIVIGSDGSKDATAQIVRRYCAKGVELYDYPTQRGKASVLNDTFPKLTGEIVLMSDANTHFESDVPRRLARWFRDPRVGVAVGRLLLSDPHTSKNGDSQYWSVENFFKQCEGKLGALIGANGAIYAIRRKLFRPIPRNTTIDDLVIPLQATLDTGCRMVYDSGTIAREDTAVDIGTEFKRRCRFGASGFQAIGMFWRLLDPRRGWIALTFLSHKILRWTCPLLMLGILLGSLLLVNVPFYRAVLLVSLILLTVSFLALLVPREWPLPKPVRLLAMFTTMNLALLVGFARWLRGGQQGVWRRTDRVSQIPRSFKPQ